jgi:competence ComEA-like helix-hairpin-helix protein
MTRHSVGSWEQLQTNIESILEQMNASPQLALAAAANPLLALEELGYDIDPAARSEITRRLRFSPRIAVRLRQLEDEVAAIAGRRVDLDSAEDLQRLLFKELRLDARGDSEDDYQQKAQHKQGWSPSLDTRPLPPDLSSIGKRDDPLRVLEGKHKVMEPVLEYRRLEASTPRLASKQDYERVREGQIQLGVEKIRGRLKGRPPTPPDEHLPGDVPAIEPSGETSSPALLNLNQATAPELERIPGIGPSLAERIVLYRTAYGSFPNLESLTEIKGIGPDLLSRISPYLTV